MSLKDVHGIAGEKTAQAQGRPRSLPAGAEPERADLRATLLQLQRSHGNHHVQRLIGAAERPDQPPEAGPDVESAIARMSGGGHALDDRTRDHMESAFGADFSGVRVHTDGEANVLNRAVEARAFTTGRDIFFSAGAYDPGNAAGRHLLAHELTHVIQQGAGPAAPVTARRAAPDGAEASPGGAPAGTIQAKMEVSQPHDAAEVEAEAMADLIARMPDRAAAPEQQPASDIQPRSQGVLYGKLLQRDATSPAALDSAVPPPAPMPAAPAQEAPAPADATPAPAAAAPAADPTHALSVWIDYNNTLNKTAGTPAARRPSSALYVKDVRLVPNQTPDPNNEKINPYGLHLSGLNQIEDGGVLLGVVQHPADVDGRVSGVVKFGTTPAITISYQDDPYVAPEADHDQVMAAARAGAAKKAQESLGTTGDGDEAVIARHIKNDLEREFLGLDFTVGLKHRGEGEAFPLPSIPYQSITNDMPMRLWVNIPSRAFVYHAKSDVRTEDDSTHGTSVSNVVTNVNKQSESSVYTDLAITSASTMLAGEISGQLDKHKGDFGGSSGIVTATTSNTFIGGLKASLGIGLDAKFDLVDLLALIPVFGEVALVGKLFNFKIPMGVSINPAGSATFTFSYKDVKTSLGTSYEQHIDDLITELKGRLSGSTSNTQYNKTKNELRKSQETYQKTVASNATNESAHASTTKEVQGESTSLIIQAKQPYLTIGEPDHTELEVMGR